MAHPLQQRFDAACDTLAADNVVVFEIDSDGRACPLSTDAIYAVANRHPVVAIQMADDITNRRVADVYGVGGRYLHLQAR